MSGVIKALGAPALVFPLAPVAVPTPSPDPVRVAMEKRLDAALAEIDRLRADAASAADTLRTRAQAMREDGRREGLAAAVDDAERRSAAVAAAAEAALVAWHERLAGTDALAAALARTGLAKLFADSDDLAELATRSIAHHLAKLRGESVIAIRVAEHDFADDAARRALRAAIGSSAADIVIDSGMAAGECRLELRLGSMDVGIGSQARALDAALAVLAGTG